MEEGLISEGISKSRETRDVSEVSHGRIPHRINGFRDAVSILISEGGLNLIRYLKKRGMSRETELLVLPAKSHYYYEENDLKRIRLLVNLRKLNVIKHLDIFLGTLVKILPPETSFVGYFSDRRTRDNHSISSTLSGLYGKMVNFLDGKTNRVMNSEDVRHLLERSGFTVENMTTISGNTYFHSHCAPRPVGLKAS